MRTITVSSAVMLCLFALCGSVMGQVEVSGWGNLRGIRVGGQLVSFSTAVGVFNPDLTQVTLSQREGPTRTSRYVREEKTVTVGESLQIGPDRGGRGGRGGPASGVSYSMSYTDSAPGACDVSIQLSTPASPAIGGVHYFLMFSAADFGGGKAELVGGPATTQASLATPDGQGRFLSGRSTGVRISGRNNTMVEVKFREPLEVVVRRSTERGSDDIQVYFPILSGAVTAGQEVKADFTLKASTDVDTRPAAISLDASKLGRTWLGIGGNYRIQNQRLDSLHIQYIMDNMRVAYGRVAMPWNAWQPDENSAPPMLAGPTTSPAPTGRGRGGGGGVMNSIPAAMEIAQKLAKQNIPMIISCWSPPNWATLPNPTGRGANLRGQRLDPAKWDAMCASIGSYLVYLRDHYGVEPELFSFNESDLGINVRQTPEDHDEAIRKLGAHFKSLGLKTRMLLGDTSDAVPIHFVQAALNDPLAIQYIGAVSFHSWRGATDEQYQKWADVAEKLNVPLLDAEGGNDAQAYSYPNIFREAWYSLDEAAEYVRIMRICQPKAILQWQLTENYSVLYADANDALQPTQRFYNLKQFNLAPSGSSWIGAKSSSDLVLPAACVEEAKGVYTVHIVNNGAPREVTVTGLPPSIASMSVYLTSGRNNMSKLDSIKVASGSASLVLEGQTLTTLINETP